MSYQAREPRDEPTPDVDVGMEEPSNDVLEQHRIDIDEAELEDPSPSPLPVEADAADVNEQRRGVPEEANEWREE
jgi:hypothetical protein